MTIKHIGFDLDGTLVDTRSLIVESVLACIPLPRRASARPVVTAGASGSPRALLRQFGISDISAYWRHHGEHAHLATLFFPQTRAVLDRLRSIGITVSIVTSLPARPAFSLLGHFGISSFFSTIDTYASQPYRKPSPQLLKIHLRNMGVAPDATAYVGDRVDDMKMATGAGAAAWGAGWGTTAVADLVNAGARLILDDLDALFIALEA